MPTEPTQTIPASQDSVEDRTRDRRAECSLDFDGFPSLPPQRRRSEARSQRIHFHPDITHGIQRGRLGLLRDNFD